MTRTTSCCHRGPMIESLEERAFCSATAPGESACTNNLRSGSTSEALYAPGKPGGVIPSTQTQTQTNLVVIAIIGVLIG